MNPFAAELRALSDRLDLPQPMRARLVAELSADLCSLAQELEARGTAVGEARRRALETLCPSPDALDSLVTMHRPLYARLVDRFSDPARNRLERSLFGLALLGLATAGAAALADFELTADPAPLTLPMLGLGLVTLALALWKSFRVYVRRTSSVVELSRGLGWLPAIAVAAVTGGLLGISLDLYGVAGELANPSPEALQRTLLLSWLTRDVAMASLALLVAALALGSWLWLSAGIARVRLAEAELDLDLGFSNSRTQGEGS